MDSAAILSPAVGIELPLFRPGDGLVIHLNWGQNPSTSKTLHYIYELHKLQALDRHAHITSKFGTITQHASDSEQDLIINSNLLSTRNFSRVGSLHEYIPSDTRLFHFV
jgi:hypothetical protein